MATETLRRIDGGKREDRDDTLSRLFTEIAGLANSTVEAMVMAGNTGPVQDVTERMLAVIGYLADHRTQVVAGRRIAAVRGDAVQWLAPWLPPLAAAGDAAGGAQ